jgi:hypothetical protein
MVINPTINKKEKEPRNIERTAGLLFARKATAIVTKEQAIPKRITDLLKFEKRMRDT